MCKFSLAITLYLDPFKKKKKSLLCFWSNCLLLIFVDSVPHCLVSIVSEINKKSSKQCVAV